MRGLNKYVQMLSNEINDSSNKIFIAITKSVCEQNISKVKYGWQLRLDMPFQVQLQHPILRLRSNGGIFCGDLEYYQLFIVLHPQDLSPPFSNYEDLVDLSLGCPESFHQDMSLLQVPCAFLPCLSSPLCMSQFLNSSRPHLLLVLS